MEIISKNLQETREIAFDLALKIQNNEFANPNGALVIGLQGNLGAGKTTFMKSLAEALGVSETIQSPTFVIMKFYETSPRPRGLGLPLSLSTCPPRRRVGRGRGERGEVGRLVHIDAYRLDSGSELLKLGWNEIVSDEKNIICIEWPERVADILDNYLRIDFQHVSENERKIVINYTK